MEVLWPDGAPRARGDAEADVPALFPFFPTAGTSATATHFEQPTTALRGAVIVCPGGGYERLAPHEGEPVARWYAERGLIAIVLRYRVAPYRHPVPANDLRRAIRVVRARAGEWGVDPDRIAVLGFSAGGHLVSTVATQPPTSQRNDDAIDALSYIPNATILCYPVISMVRNQHEGSVKRLLGDDADLPAREALSSELHVTSATPPTFLWHCADDNVVPVENSLAFTSALRDNGVPFELHVFERGGHGGGLAESNPNVRAWAGLSLQWLRIQGW